MSVSISNVLVMINSGRYCIYLPCVYVCVCVYVCIYIYIYIYIYGVVGKALRYKTAGRGFDSGWCHWNFSVI
jgi:hypothetical protein